MEPVELNKVDNINEMYFYRKILSLFLKHTRLNLEDVKNIGVDFYPAGECQNCPDGDRVIKGFYISFNRLVSQDELRPKG